MANRAILRPGGSRRQAILRALSGVLGHTLPFDSLQALRANLYGDFPHMAHVDGIAAGKAKDVTALARAVTPKKSYALVSPVSDFYLTNAIARASAVMAECSQLMAGMKQAAE